MGLTMVRNACAEYKTLVDCGSNNDLIADLTKVSAMIAADLPTRIYGVSMGGIDTHAAKAGAHQTLMIYLSDAICGFNADIERIRRDDAVSMVLRNSVTELVRMPARGLPRYRDADVHLGQAGQEWLPWRSSKSDRSGRRQHENDNRFPIRVVRHHVDRMATLIDSHPLNARSFHSADGVHEYVSQL